MGQFKLLTTYSPWLILACLAVGALYAWLLYSKKTPWSPKLNYFLASIRFIVISFLCFLLLGPYVKAVTNTTEKPTIVVAIDNSQSVGLFTDKNTLANTTTGLDDLIQKLEDHDFNVKVKTLDLLPNNNTDLKPSETKFTNATTNLDELLSETQAMYASQNLAGVVLLSDGIVNKGKSPVYSNYNFNIFPVAIGDTIPKKDIYIPSLLYNKIAYSGNKFPVVAEINSEGFQGGTTTVVIKENGRILDRKTVTLSRNQSSTRVEFTLTAAEPGKKHYEITALPQKGEYTTVNNTKHAYLDIIKGKLTVLIAAAAPHPDIKALRAAIETNDNFETVLYIPGILPLKAAKYDVAVLHQIPSRLKASDEALTFIRDKNIPALYIVGSQTDIGAFNNLRAGITINRRGSQTDQVTPALNANFTKFQIDETISADFTRYPPAEVPFADFALAPNTEVILFQQVGRVKTTKPLLTSQVNNDKRSVVLVADGIWQWRLTESATTKNEKPEAFDKLMVGVVQLLSAQQNKKRLNVYPVQDEFYVSDEIRFEADVYNAIYEKIYGQNISLRITDEKNKNRSFSFVNGEGFTGLNVGSLPGGVYTYTASASIDGKTQQDKGEFVVQELQLETINSLADHDLLHQLAQKTGSHLYYPTQLEQLQQDLLKADYKNIIYSNENLEDLINLEWLFFIVLALVSVEWFLRKYYGTF
ncbi:VWA domain-containing protein [Adhaeribacter aquaticus]|uniref:VWA domain-containing protein n=1 Tax=Adhaeribacter aquaticus TaxID=299567 RepID=UPI000416BBD0|nr:VWA domain-containing protein [Adhaeribacter aquaticus]